MRTFSMSFMLLAKRCSSPELAPRLPLVGVEKGRSKSSISREEEPLFDSTGRVGLIFDSRSAAILRRERIEGKGKRFVIRHTSYAIRHTPYVIRHTLVQRAASKNVQCVYDNAIKGDNKIY
jgi:hypothetical protein